MKPGDLGFMDMQYCPKQAEKIKRIIHRWFRAEVRGKQHIPSRNFIAVGNHGGGAWIPDTLVWLSEYHTSQQQTSLLSLTNPAVFSLYPEKIACSLAKMGAVRADPRIALAALSAGHSLQVYPGGDFDACRIFSKRNEIVFGGNMAYAKLAIKTQTPILPVLSVGGHNSLIVLNDGARIARYLKLDKKYGLKTFPLAFCLPWGLWFGPLIGHIPFPSKITIEVLPPIEPDKPAEELDTHVRSVLQSRLNTLVGRKPHTKTKGVHT